MHRIRDIGIGRSRRSNDDGSSTENVVVVVPAAPPLVVVPVTIFNESYNLAAFNAISTAGTDSGQYGRPCRCG
jgi:hypothetical protein